MAGNDHTRSPGSVSRRKFLVGASSVGAVGIAGCTSTSGDGGLGGGDGDSGDGPSGEVIVTGSSTVFPVSDEMAERFMDENDNVNVITDSTGSGGGFANNFCPGSSDINGASRPIKDAEIQSCDENDVEAVEFQIAGDALTMAVSPENDWVDSMTFDELAQIWNGDDPAQTWADVNPEWPDEEFELFGPDDTSGTFDWFTENVVGEAGNHRSDYEPTEDDNTIIQGISNNEYAIGYFGYAYYQENQDMLKALSIAETADNEPAAPSLEARVWRLPDGPAAVYLRQRRLAQRKRSGLRVHGVLSRKLQCGVHRRRHRLRPLQSRASRREPVDARRVRLRSTTPELRQHA